MGHGTCCYLLPLLLLSPNLIPNSGRPNLYSEAFVILNRPNTSTTEGPGRDTAAVDQQVASVSEPVYLPGPLQSTNTASTKGSGPSGVQQVTISPGVIDYPASTNQPVKQVDNFKTSTTISPDLHKEAITLSEINKHAIIPSNKTFSMFDSFDTKLGASDLHVKSTTVSDIASSSDKKSLLNEGNDQESNISIGLYSELMQDSPNLSVTPTISSGIDPIVSSTLSSVNAPTTSNVDSVRNIRPSKSKGKRVNIVNYRSATVKPTSVECYIRLPVAGTNHSRMRELWLSPETSQPSRDQTEPNTNQRSSTESNLATDKLTISSNSMTIAPDNTAPKRNQHQINTHLTIYPKPKTEITMNDSPITYIQPFQYIYPVKVGNIVDISKTTIHPVADVTVSSNYPLESFVQGLYVVAENYVHEPHMRPRVIPIQPSTSSIPPIVEEETLPFDIMTKQDLYDQLAHGRVDNSTHQILSNDSRAALSPLRDITIDTKEPFQQISSSTSRDDVIQYGDRDQQLSSVTHVPSASSSADNLIVVVENDVIEYSDRDQQLSSVTHVPSPSSSADNLMIGVEHDVIQYGVRDQQLSSVTHVPSPSRSADNLTVGVENDVIQYGVRDQQLSSVTHVPSPSRSADNLTVGVENPVQVTTLSEVNVDKMEIDDKQVPGVADSTVDKDFPEEIVRKPHSEDRELPSSGSSIDVNPFKYGGYDQQVQMKGGDIDLGSTSNRPTTDQSLPDPYHTDDSKYDIADENWNRTDDSNLEQLILSHHSEISIESTNISKRLSQDVLPVDPYDLGDNKLANHEQQVNSRENYSDLPNSLEKPVEDVSSSEPYLTEATQFSSVDVSVDVITHGGSKQQAHSETGGSGEIVEVSEDDIMRAMHAMKERFGGVGRAAIVAPRRRRKKNQGRVVGGKLRVSA